MNKAKTPVQIINKLNALKGKRVNFESVWQAIGDWVVPRKNDIQNTQFPGEPKYNDLLDTTAMTYSELLAGALHSMLTNPSGYFFNMTTGDLALDQNDNVREWIQKVVRIIHDILTNSNFHTEEHEFDLDLVNFGTGTKTIEEDDADIVRFCTRFIKEMYIEENSRGIVDCVYRCYKAKARDLVDDFGFDKLPKKVQDAHKSEKGEEFEVVHAVYPVAVDGSYGKSLKGKKFVSQYVLVTEKQDLSVEGYMESPYVVSRWTKSSGETYGRGCGEKAVPPSKLANKMMETTLKGGQKTVDPPLQVPDDGFILPIKTRPAGLNFFRAGSEDRITPIFNDARIDYGIELIQMIQTQVKEAFYADQLKLREGPQMTATEVSERVEQAVRFLGPMLARQESENLQPTLMRVYHIAERKNKIPEPPAELAGIPIQFKYSSVMAMAQRASELQSINRTMQTIAPFASADPSMLDIFDGVKAGKYIAKLTNFPQEIIRNEEEIKAIRAQREKAAQAQMDAQNEAMQADSASKLTSAAAKVAPQRV
jgi:hypothetical protein